MFEYIRIIPQTEKKKSLLLIVLNLFKFSKFQFPEYSSQNSPLGEENPGYCLLH